MSDPKRKRNDSDTEDHEDSAAITLIEPLGLLEDHSNAHVGLDHSNAHVGLLSPPHSLLSNVEFAAASLPKHNVAVTDLLDPVMDTSCDLEVSLGMTCATNLLDPTNLKIPSPSRDYLIPPSVVNNIEIGLVQDQRNVESIDCEHCRLTSVDIDTTNHMSTPDEWQDTIEGQVQVATVHEEAMNVVRTSIDLEDFFWDCSSAEENDEEWFDSWDWDQFYWSANLHEDDTEAEESLPQPDRLVGSKSPIVQENTLLYSNAPLTVHESAMAILSYILKSHTSGADLVRLLDLINLHLPHENNFLSTPYYFHKYFENIKSPLVCVYYCDICHGSLDNKESKCDRCGPDAKSAFYIHIPLAPQLENLYKKKGFVDLLSHRSTRQKINDANYEDIYDGEIYQECLKTILAYKYAISLMWNVDGLSLYKSSNFQVWPFFLTINELPPSLRGKQEYMLLAGLAFGSGKPSPNIFLRPVYEEMKVLSSTGIEVQSPDLADPITVKAYIICGTCDAPAKSLFFRIKGHSGYYACPHCLATGENSQRTGLVTVYPFEEQLHERNKQHYVDTLKLVKETKKGECGIAGPTLMQLLVHTYFLASTAVDGMHAVYLGVTRQLLQLYFSSAYVKDVFGNDATVKEIRNILGALMESITPPHFVQRRPRSFKDILYFKASELRSWLFHYSLPILEKTMAKKYFEHFKLFVVGIYLLNTDSVSKDDVVLSELLLSKFVKDFQALFGLRNMSFNLHCLRHLSKCVSLLGPMWVTSCFKFENLNGQLANLVQGTRYAGLQIHSNIGILSHLPDLVRKLSAGKVKDFCSNLFVSVSVPISETIAKHVYVIGDVVKILVIPPHQVRALSQSNVNGTNYSFFFRFKSNGLLYVSDEYRRAILKNSSSVLYLSNNNSLDYGVVKYFIRVTSCSCQTVCVCSAEYCAMIQKYHSVSCFQIENVNVNIASLLSVQLSDNYEVVPVSALKTVCFKVTVNNADFVSVPPNSHEYE